MTRYALVLCMAVASVLLGSSASAHEYTPGVLALKEVAAGRFLARWSPPTPSVEGLKIHFPDACQIEGSTVLDAQAPQARLAEMLDCGAAGLVGTITFESADVSLGRISVNTEWLDGTTSFRLSSGMPPRVEIGGSVRVSGALYVLRDYVGLGVQHIWWGMDHLLFLLGLMLLVTSWQSLLVTVTAFTVAHSVTLVAASLQLVSVPSGPVEICIALSVLLLAVEAHQGSQTLTRRWPWLVAFGFGLLHGLGFASALSEVGLPKNAVALGLFSFNLGVEVGQLTVVGIALPGFWLLRARPQARQRVEWSATWVLGICAVFWLLQRVESWLVDLGVLGSWFGA